MRRRVRRFMRCDVSVGVVLRGRDGAGVQHVVHHRDGEGKEGEGMWTD